MQAILALLIRQGLAACGGFFAANNITGSSTSSIIIGLIMLMIPTVWSWIAKVIHLEDSSKYGFIENSEIIRTLLGSIVSQAITALSVYFATDANNPELLGVALANAAASKFGLQQKLARIGAKDAIKAFAVLGSLFSVCSCSALRDFAQRHEATLDAIVIDAAHTAADAALSKLKRSAKQPVNVQPDEEREIILEGPEPACEEPRGEMLPACLKITPSITIPRYGIQVAASLR